MRGGASDGGLFLFSGEYAAASCVQLFAVGFVTSLLGSVGADGFWVALLPAIWQAPVSISQTATVASPPTAARRRPSGSNAKPSDT